jgi:hypothetical protein
MRKVLFLGLAASCMLSTAQAGNGNNPKRVPLLKPVPFVTHAKKLEKAQQAEARANATTKKPVAFSNSKRSGGSNSVQATTVVYSDLGTSINPFTVITAGRNCVGVAPAINTVAFFRRGGDTDPGGTTDRPGNKLYYDLNTKGGAEGFWQITKGPLFSDDLFVDAPNYDAGSSNYAPRYPQGALWSPAGNTDTAQAYAFGVAAVLDGTNGTWGGMGRGWQKLQAGSPSRTNLWSSPDPLHYISEGMEVSSTGSVFAVNAERDASGTGVAFTDKITIYRYNYNQTTQNFDSTATYIPFSNEGGEYATVVGSSQIAFGPDGQTGYLAVSAANNEFDSTATFLPYIAKTTDGGNSWSNLKLLPINKRWNEQASPEKDAFRDQLLVGNRVKFSDAGIVPTTYDDPYGHFVDYLVNDMELTVDKDNYAHVFASIAVSGFGDTLNATFPGGITYYPGYGSWNIDLYINNMDSAARGILINQNVTLNGCWGDCAGTENFKEANRPQISRSADGSVVVFSWYDTDTTAYPQLDPANNNSNPDLWIRTMRVGNPGQYFLNDKPRNITKGSDKDGLAVLGNAAPTLLNTANGYGLASVIVALSDFVDVTSPWPIQHLYVGGVNVPSAAAVDSFPVVVGQGKIILETNPQVSAKKLFNMDMSVMPNPSKGFMTAHLSVEKAGMANIRVINSIGQTVQNISMNLPKGDINVPLQLSQLAKGVYTIQVQMENQTGTKRIIKD